MNNQRHDRVSHASESVFAEALATGWSHRHRDVSGGWLRPTVFGAVDGLVTNASLIAGVGGAGVPAHAIVLTGLAGLAAGAFSMGTGEYISVTNQNELVHAEVALEASMHAQFPEAEQAELTNTFIGYGADPQTAARMAAGVSADPEMALQFHTRDELGVDPQTCPPRCWPALPPWRRLVIELGIILILIMGWEFAAAEFVGGPVMIIVLAVLFRFFLRPGLVDAARRQADKGIAGSMEGHAAMDMSVSEGGSVWRRLSSSRGFTAVSHIFIMEWAAVLRDIVIGLLIAGAVAAWVPAGFWQGFFLVDHPLLAKLWGPIVGPIVAVLSFVCSIGNVPLAAVLWNGGISFGGVVSFIFADLLIIPILVIYRKYYGPKMAAFVAVTFYVASVAAGYVVELIFGLSGLVPEQRHARVEMAHVSWNYTSFLNIAFLLLAAVLIIRFLRTGGPAMLKMMGGGPDDMNHHDHDTGHHTGGHDTGGHETGGHEVPPQDEHRP